MTVEKVRIVNENFSIDAEIERVKAASGRIGGIVTFLGTVRNFSRGREIKKLVFENYAEMAIAKMKTLRERALEKFDIIEISLLHRTGEIEVGENIVLVIVGAEHRKDAFLACAWLMDELKNVVPIWKKEVTADGEVWVDEHA